MGSKDIDDGQYLKVVVRAFQLEYVLGVDEEEFGIFALPLMKVMVAVIVSDLTEFITLSTR